MPRAVPSGLDFSRPGDPADLLPPECRDVFDARREAAQDAFAAARSAGERERQAAERLTNAQIRLQHLKTAHSGTKVRLSSEEADIEAAKAEVSKSRDRHARASEKAQHLGRPVSRAEDYLIRLPADAELTPWTGKEPALHKGEDAAEAAARMRGIIDRLRADLHTVRTAPKKSSEVKAVARAAIQAAAERGRVGTLSLFETGDLTWPEIDVKSSIHGVAVGSGGSLPVSGFAQSRIPDALSVMIWLHRDALIAAVEREIMASADDQHALTDSERASREADILAKLLQAERDEVHFVDAAGAVMFHRPDVDPRALLGVVGPAPRER